MKIGIVNDLRMAVEVLRMAVAQAGHSVLWTAGDGEQAVRLARQETPDLILMDLVMPVMNGAEASRRIMQESPCAILVVTASLDTNSELVYESMGYGALDAVRTPSMLSDGTLEGADPLWQKIERIRIITGKKTQDDSQTGTAPSAPAEGLPGLVAVGSSTGGPQALAGILSNLRSDFPAAIVIVQHVDPEFAAGLADWLSARSRIPVRVARMRQAPVAGEAWLAVTGDHLRVDGGGRLLYTPEPRELVYRPSVDVFFQSLARHWPEPGVAALLTGMGRDGAEGLLKLRERGWQTIAQDEASSVVYGMPKAAVQNDAAKDILSPEAIAERLNTRYPVKEHG